MRKTNRARGAFPLRKPLPPLGVAIVVLVIVVSMMEIAQMIPAWLSRLIFLAASLGVSVPMLGAWWRKELQRRLRLHTPPEPYLHRILLRACRLMAVPAAAVGPADAPTAVRAGWAGAEVTVVACAGQAGALPQDAGMIWLPLGGDIRLIGECTRRQAELIRAKGGVWTVPLRLWWCRLRQGVGRRIWK